MTVALAAAALGAASCTANYEDINRNPYEVTAEDMERDGYAMRSFMTTMQSWVIPADVNQCQFTDLLLGGPYGGYIAYANSGFNAGKFSTYDPQSNWSPVFYRVVNAFPLMWKRVRKSNSLKGVSLLVLLFALSSPVWAEENATGQMIDDAALAIKKTHKDRNIPAYALTYVYNTPPINRIKEDYFKVKSGEIKEVY